MGEGRACQGWIISDQDILATALALPRPERARLAHELIASLDEAEPAGAALPVKIVLHAGATAELELEEAEDWYEEQRPGLGDDLAAEVDRALEIPRETPETWPRWPGSPPVPCLRRFLLTRFPYALAYVAERDRVVVLAVAHGKRRPGYWFHRLKLPS